MYLVSDTNLHTYKNPDNYDQLAAGFKTAGFYGNGNGKITFSEDYSPSETGMIYTITNSGPLNAMPGYQMLYKRMYWEKEFSVKQSWQVDMAGMFAKYSVEGSMNGGEKFSLNQVIKVTDFKSSRKGDSVALGFSQTCDNDIEVYSSNLDWMNQMCYNAELELDLSNTKQCDHSPFTPGCEMNMGWSGELNGNDIDEFKFIWNAKSDSLLWKFDCEAHGLHQVRIDYNSLQKYDINYKQGDSPWMNIFSMFGPANFNGFVYSIEKYVEPFSVYMTQGLLSFSENSVLSVVWVDRAFNNLKNEFDCSAIVEASMFESEFFQMNNGGKTLQESLKSCCQNFNGEAVYGLQELGNNAIAPARAYVNGLTSEEDGGEKFNQWYTAVYRN